MKDTGTSTKTSRLRLLWWDHSGVFHEPGGSDVRKWGSGHTEDTREMRKQHVIWHHRQHRNSNVTQLTSGTLKFSDASMARQNPQVWSELTVRLENRRVRIDPRSSWQPFVPTKCLHPWQVSSSQASVQKWGAVSLSAHPFYFFLEFSSQGFLLSLPYSYRKVQFLFCLGFSHPNLNQKYPVIGILLQACSSQQYAMDIFPCEHKEVYLIILEL